MRPSRPRTARAQGDGGGLDETLTPSALNVFFRAIFEYLNYSFLRRRQLGLRVTAGLSDEIIHGFAKRVLKMTTFFTHHCILITTYTR